MLGVCRVSSLCLASALAAIGGVRAGEAACVNPTTGLPVNLSQPTSNQTVVCDTNPPNPTSTVISAAAGSTNVSVTVLPGSILSTGVRAIGVVNNSTVLNQGQVSTGASNAFGVTTTGDGSTLTNQGTITTTGSGSHGLDARGSNSTLINSGTINVSGLNAGASGQTKRGVRSLSTAEPSRPRPAPASWARTPTSPSAIAATLTPATASPSPSATATTSSRLPAGPSPATSISATAATSSP